MKKLFYVFAAVVIGFVMTACNQSNDGYSLEVTAVYDNVSMQPFVTITASAEATPFVLLPFTEAELNGVKDKELVKAILAQDFVQTDYKSQSGTYFFGDMIWEPGTTYKFVVLAIDPTTKEAKGDLATATVEIPVLSANKLSLQFDNKDGIQISATTEDNFFVDIVTADAKATIDEKSTAAAYVALSLANYIQLSAENHKDDAEKMSYTDLANLYFLNGSTTLSLLENNDVVAAGKYYAVGAGVGIYEDNTSYRVQPTTTGVYSAEFELTEDLVWSEEVKAALIKSLKFQPAKVRRAGEFRIDLTPNKKATRVE